MKKRLFMTFVILVTFCLSSFGEIKYRVSGRVIYKGKGINDIRINVGFKDAYTKNDGSFYLYLPNGHYMLSLFNRYKYINSFKKIEVKSKNIKNIIIFLKKGGSISGTVKYEDGTPASGRIKIYIDKGINNVGSPNIKSNGTYIKKNIIGEDIVVIADVFGTPFKKIEGISVKDEEVVKNINFIFLNKVTSLSGKVRDFISKGLVDSSNLTISAFCAANLPRPILVHAFINNNGEFFFYNLPNGKYTISSDAYEYKEKSFQVIINNRSGSKYLLIELEKK